MITTVKISSAIQPRRYPTLAPTVTAFEFVIFRFGNSLLANGEAGETIGDGRERSFLFQGRQHLMRGLERGLQGSIRVKHAAEAEFGEFLPTQFRRAAAEHDVGDL